MINKTQERRRYQHSFAFIAFVQMAGWLATRIKHHMDHCRTFIEHELWLFSQKLS